MGGVDIDVRLLVNLRRFTKENCIAGLCLVERGSALTQKHFQMVVRGNFNSLLVLNQTIKVCLDWDVSPLMRGHVVSCKKLRDEGLHTFKGTVDYCMNDNGEEHFEYVHNNVSSQDMNECKLEYVKFMEIGLNNPSVSIS